MRITGGVYRSRVLRAPRGVRTRPTADRVRKALFDVLCAARSLDGVRVLDLYAGTGALGIEAVSRGAAHATLVESARPALDAIRHNIDALGLTAHVRVVASAVDRAAGAVAAHAPYDLVMADPPYALVRSGEAPRVIAELLRTGIASPDARVVLEHAAPEGSPPIEGLALTESRRYGDTALAFYAVKRPAWFPGRGCVYSRS